MTEGEFYNYVQYKYSKIVKQHIGQVYDEAITMTELNNAVQELQNNKAAGSDGLTGEFDEVSWNDISHLVLKNVYAAFNIGVF